MPRSKCTSSLRNNVERMKECRQSASCMLRMPMPSQAVTCRQTQCPDTDIDTCTNTGGANGRMLARVHYACLGCQCESSIYVPTHTESRHRHRHSPNTDIDTDTRHEHNPDTNTRHGHTQNTQNTQMVNVHSGPARAHGTERGRGPRLDVLSLDSLSL